jgi:CRP/FNR family transcriptional regulator
MAWKKRQKDSSFCCRLGKKYAPQPKYAGVPMITKKQICSYPFFANLSEADLENIAARLVKRTFAKGAYLYYPGNPSLNMYLIESGLARLFFCNERGQEFLVNLAGPHSIIGLVMLLGGQARIIGAAAQQPLVALSLSDEDLFHFMKTSPQFHHNVLMETNTTLIKLMRQYQSVVTVSLQGRLALIILFLARENNKAEFDLPVTQAELATWLGSSRGRLNRAMSELQRLGMIRIEGQKISILNRQGLAELTEGIAPLKM